MVHYVALYKLQRIIININHSIYLSLTGYGCSKHMHVQNFGYKQKKKKKKKMPVMLNAHGTKTNLI